MNIVAKSLGKFEKSITNKTRQIPIADLKEGINDVGNHIIKLHNGNISYIINKVCNHAGGRLIVKGDTAVCPMHNWLLDLNTLKYNRSHECKEEEAFTLKDGIIEIQDEEKLLINPYKSSESADSGVKFRWLNHATVYFEFDGFSLITDPWLFGPAFMTGWWLYDTSPSDSVELLQKADVVYISHNHPDHLHPETLACIARDKMIVVADFKTGSTEKYLQKLGFTNIHPLEFNEIYELHNQFQVSILKSGDFRDDSGIYLCINQVQFMLTVDSNFLNAHVLPEQVDMLMTSFAGGASGFPLCFEDYDEQEKAAILKRNRLSMKSKASMYLDVCKPVYYMPYAGMFKEYSYRDEYIKMHNVKNNASDYRSVCESRNVQYVEPAADKEFVFRNGRLECNHLDVSFMDREDTQFYVDKFREEYAYSEDEVLKYFMQSAFEDNLLLQIIPTDDEFFPLSDNFLSIDFAGQEFCVRNIAELVEEIPGKQVSTYRIRQEILMCVVRNYLPWEDLSIGFQLRVNRSPNVYESKFWYYFTNEYIAKEHFRHSVFCGACTIVDQNPVWNKRNTLGLNH